MAYRFKGLYFEEFAIGDVHESASRTITEADIQSFAGLSGDYNPLHTDAVFAKSTPFKTRIAHGALSFSVSTGLMNQLGIFDGTVIGFMEANNKFVGPVKPGDTIRCRLTVKEKKLSAKGGRGVIAFGIDVLNQEDQVVLEGIWTMLVLAKEK